MLLSVVKDFINDFLMQYSHLVGGEREVQLFQIEKDKIDQGDSSIKYSKNNLLNWTHACKCLLMQLKRITDIIRIKDDKEKLWLGKSAHKF